MNTLQYKDYQGAVTFEDGTLLIQILHIDDYITTACDSAAAAQTVFEELVDDYLDTCRSLGKEPSKPFKGTFNVRIGSGLHRKAALAATDLGQTLNAWIVDTVKQRLHRDQILKSIREVFRANPWEMFFRQSPFEPGSARMQDSRYGPHPLPEMPGSIDVGRAKAQQLAGMQPNPNPWYVTRDWN